MKDIDWSMPTTNFSPICIVESGNVVKELYEDGSMDIIATLPDGSKTVTCIPKEGRWSVQKYDKDWNPIEAARP